jgi:hypothetical protein
MAWRNSSVWMSGGLVASVGLLWLGRAFKRRELSPRSGQIEPVDSGTDSPSEPTTAAPRQDEGFEAEPKSERRARLEAKLDAIVREETSREAAHDDAMRDIEAEGLNFDDGDERDDERDDVDIVFDTLRNPQDVEWPPRENVQSNAHFGPRDEPYDAVDPEDVGSEWLTRATQATPAEGRDPVDLLDGTNIDDASIEVDIDLDDESDYGTDQDGEPLAPHAGVAEEDVAARLPVGNVDERGNVELHTPVLPRDAFRAPPTSELSPTEEEIARRAAATNAARRERH